MQILHSEVGWGSFDESISRPYTKPTPLFEDNFRIEPYAKFFPTHAHAHRPKTRPSDSEPPHLIGQSVKKGDMEYLASAYQGWGRVVGSDNNETGCSDRVCSGEFLSDLGVIGLLLMWLVWLLFCLIMIMCVPPILILTEREADNHLCWSRFWRSVQVASVAANIQRVTTTLFYPSYTELSFWQDCVWSGSPTDLKVGLGTWRHWHMLAHCCAIILCYLGREI